jgi:hypothetical protein
MRDKPIKIYERKAEKEDKDKTNGRDYNPYYLHVNLLFLYPKATGLAKILL